MVMHIASFIIKKYITAGQTLDEWKGNVNISHKRRNVSGIQPIEIHINC